MIFLDSTFLIKIIRKNKHTLNVLKSFDDISLVTSVINVYEVWLGFYKNKRIVSDINYKETIEKRINKVFSSIQILHLDKSSAKLSAEIGGTLIKNGRDIGDKDAIICGIMKFSGIKLILTSNVKHFGRVKDLIAINEDNSVTEVLKILKNS